MTSPQAVKVGVLACQRDPFLRKLKTTVISCKEASQNVKSDDISSKFGERGRRTFYSVLVDSVLFPEGGGQPCDYGSILRLNRISDPIAVFNVQRIGDQCVLYTSEPLEEGEEVEVEVDWSRRLDHMQHHSGQHLLSAIVERELNMPTLSWALSTPTCYIQLPCQKIEKENIEKVENICNALIRDGVPIECRVFESKDTIPPSRSGSIPNDVTGPIRLIDILNDIDSCTCCGTHVKHLGQLQGIKILHQEPKKDTLRLHFVLGERILSGYSQMFFREKELIKELGALPEEICSKVVKRGKDMSEISKITKRLFTEIATLLLPSVELSAKAAAFANQKVHVYYREDVDMDFLTVLAPACKAVSPSLTTVLYCGKGVSDGQFLLVGSDTDAIQKLCGIICKVADGKGGGKGETIRGRCDAKKLKQYLKNNTLDNVVG